jgi:hypothetical protein
MADRSPIYKSLWIHRHSLVVRSSVLEHHLESPDGRVQESEISSTLEQGTECPAKAPCRIFGRTFGCQESPGQGSIEVLLATCKKWWEVVANNVTPAQQAKAPGPEAW